MGSLPWSADWSGPVCGDTHARDIAVNRRPTVGPPKPHNVFTVPDREPSAYAASTGNVVTARTRGGQTPPVLASAGLPARRLTTHPVGRPFDAVDPGRPGRDAGVSVNLSPLPTLTQYRAPHADPEQRNGRLAGNRLNLGGPM